MNELKLLDLYTFHLLKLYHYYFENCIPQYGAYHQNLRNNHLRLPAIRCEFEKNNSKYQCTSDCASCFFHPTPLYIQTFI